MSMQIARTQPAPGTGFRSATRFGRFGGCFAAETLMPSLLELEAAFLDAKEDPSFNAELDGLLATYAGRPTPLTHAKNVSRLLGCTLYLKREDLLHTGAHKLNHSLGQALLARLMGKRELIAETGAGQHGVATATAGALLGLEVRVHMGAEDIQRQAPNVQRMRLLGAQVIPVDEGQRTLKDAVNAALRDWVGNPRAHYCLGSALGPHPFPSMVAHFQAVVGDEARAQFATQAGGLPDVALACVGGGSNAIGLFRAFRSDGVELIGVEAGGCGSGASGEHAARFSTGEPGVLHGCHTRVLRDSDGQVQPTASISAGLDYPAVGPEHAHLAELGAARYETASDNHALRAFRLLARYEGILPALESSHALGFLLARRSEFRGRRVLLNLSGRGDKDLESAVAGLAERRQAMGAAQ